MKRIIGNIYEEDDYSVFKRLPDNRDVLSKRLNKLIASMTEKYICNPIIVNEKMEVIDGQGRFEARKEMGVPIHYIVAEGATINDCRRMNKYNTQWSKLDFAKSYASRGIADYVTLLRTCKQTRLAISSVLRLANRGGVADADAMSPLERGELVFTEKDAETVVHVMELIGEIWEALTFTDRISDAFRNGVKVMSEMEGYNHERMLRNCKTQRGSFNQMTSLGSQLKEFERIYNYKTKAKDKLYFSDYMRDKGRAIRDYSKTYSEYDDKDVSTLK